MVLSAAFAAGLGAAESGGVETVASAAADGTAVVAPAAADGGAATPAPPTCWLAWLTTGLLGCRGVGIGWLFLGDSGWLAFGSSLIEVVGDQRS
jgi:hypothetical protein